MLQHQIFQTDIFSISELDKLSKDESQVEKEAYEEAQEKEKEDEVQVQVVTSALEHRLSPNVIQIVPEKRFSSNWH